MNESQKQDAELSAEAIALAKVARATLGHMTDEQRARGLVVVNTRVARRPARARRRLALGVAAVAVAAVAVVMAPRLGHRGSAAEAPLAYRIEGASVATGGIIATVDGGASTLRFADGTQVAFMKGTRARLTEVDQRGARFTIEGGTASVQVTPRPGARWLFDAGPFLITVHGTVFTAGWDEAAGQLNVRLQKGLVSVSGPVAGGPIAVRGGQELVVTLRQSRVTLRELASDARQPAASAPPAASAAPAVAVEPVPAERPPAVREPAAAVAHPAPPRARSSWPAALAAGDLDAIIREADRARGAALATRGSDELAALADAARFRQRGDLARAALLAQRDRFPATARARDAAFFLGRLDEAEPGHLPDAVQWYDRYLQEAPSGTYAAEALGRKMVAVQRLYGIQRARLVADEYVRQFPSGTYAGAARALRAHP